MHKTYRNEATVALGTGVLAVLLLWAPPVARSQSVLKAARDLTVTVIVSPDDNWVKQWNTPQAPHVTRVHKIQVDQKVTVGVVLSGLRAVKGHVRYRVAAQILDPKGKKIFDRPDFANCTLPAPPQNTFSLVNPTFDFSAENSDPRGVYRFRAVVTDLNRPKGSHANASGEWKVELQ